MTTRRRLWAKLDETLNAGFSGQITLNCQRGVVLRVEKRDIEPAPAEDESSAEHRKAG